MKALIQCTAFQLPPTKNCLLMVSSSSPCVSVLGGTTRIDFPAPLGVPETDVILTKIQISRKIINEFKIHFETHFERQEKREEKRRKKKRNTCHVPGRWAFSSLLLFYSDRHR